MRRIILAASLGFFVALGPAGVALGPAGAAGKTVNESITIIQAFPGGPPAGWFASGVFTDGGSWTSDRVVGSFASPVTAAFHRDTTETGSDGTFHLTINFTRTVIGLAATSWSIQPKGTGAYASLTGNGTCAPSVASDGTFHVTCAGNVNLG